MSYLFSVLEHHIKEKMDLKIAKIRSLLSIGRLYVVKKGYFQLVNAQEHAKARVSDLYH